MSDLLEDDGFGGEPGTGGGDGESLETELEDGFDDPDEPDEPEDDDWDEGEE